ncbi:uncharacterized protein LOC126904845 isoform X1 [Daktulosphaira vitifoliae]|uniref:uncharacterized protein LOC126904845 isoform X1 n=1 Tax=Daktulosphaira vitifoliae TaxID=58002 RepID=UPI0021AA2DC4|nr:uncharacterized protein LOC126904845 isoform X1 [Daktulosphaira vitifoliae]
MGRKIPLSNSCMGFSLKTGAITSGVYGIVIAIITLIVILVNEDLRIQTIIVDFLPKSVVRIIVAINLIMTIVICSILLAGVFMRKKILMLPWIVLTILLCIGLVISILYTAIDYLIHSYYITSVLVLVIGLLFVCLYVYMWWVTYSYYQQIKEEDNRTPYTRTPYYG